MGTLATMLCLLAVAPSPDPPIHSDQPYAVTFPAVEARMVRVVIEKSSDGMEPCIDELEIYGPDGKDNLALESRHAVAAASSCLAGYEAHRVEHLNDGRYGNQYSWIPATTAIQWAQIELPQAVKVDRVVISRDRRREYGCRVPIEFEVLVSTDGNEWKSVKTVKTTAAPVAVRHLGPQGINAQIPGSPPAPRPLARQDRAGKGNEGMLRYAFLGEEAAWLRTYGRADLNPLLVPYNGRVKNYPRHVRDDCLPLPTMASIPKLDGVVDDAAWTTASRGVARIADPYNFDAGPLVECVATAGIAGDHLYLAIQTNRLLSSHVAVLSSEGTEDAWVLVCTDAGPVLKRYRSGNAEESKPAEGKFSTDLTCWEIRMPLAMFPELKTLGLRVGLGMGGKHTSDAGREIRFMPSRLAIAEVTPCVNKTFRVRLTAAPGDQNVTVRGNAPGLVEGLVLAPGESKIVSIPADGPIGPEHALNITTGKDETYALGLFRYDPMHRAITLFEEMVQRFADKGRNVEAERAEVARLQKLDAALASMEKPNAAAERKAFYDARAAKRRLFFREDDLAPIEKLLYVKRHAYEPSHNYSVMLDSAWRPGGAVCRLDIPRDDGRLLVERAKTVELFNAQKGIARDPMADFDAETIYFAHRPLQSDYFHIMRMRPDGSEVKQLTEGPFHDYWPCPLPDGGLGFITTRCKCRFLCWRPQAAVMFRMDADGSKMQPLSFANLTEWGPSVMRDGRIIWTRSEYVDKGADFSHTLWMIRPDGTQPELVFGNTIIQPNGYANGREVTGTHEICCTLISHFGDLNGPIALVDIDQGRFNPKAITSITPEVPWPGAPPLEECFRDPVPVATDYFLCSHAPLRQFGLYVIDRFGNREPLAFDETFGCMCPTMLRAVPRPPVLRNATSGLTLAKYNEPRESCPTDLAKAIPGGTLLPTPTAEPEEVGVFSLADVYRGIEPTVARGTVKYIRVACEVRNDLEQLANGEYRKDHDPFMHFYASPVDVLSGPYGWPSYVAKASYGLAPVEEDGSAHFYAPAGKQLYLQILDKDFNELQRMRSVVQLQPGEQRSCVGCHEDRRQAPPVRQGIALRREPSRLEPPPWGAGPIAYEKVVQPVWDAACVQCHGANDKKGINLTATLDKDRIPASYRTLISQGWVHYLDWGWNSGGNEKAQPLTFGTVKSKLFKVLDAGHHDVKFSTEQMRRIKVWIDLNCPLWPDYTFRENRPAVAEKAK
jgi:hypothetical protein